MYYFSLPYFLYILITVCIVLSAFFALRSKSDRVKKVTVFVLMMINFFQHIFKSFIYPHLWGEGFTGLNTAYNMCAFLILSTPFIFLFGSELWKNFIVYVGTAAGVVAICVPYWFTVETAFSSEAIRFYLCHILLVATSILPALLGFYPINWRKSWKLPFLFYLALIFITFNEIICFITGLFDGGGDLFMFLKSVNPCWAFGPIEGFEWVAEIASVFIPDYLLKTAAGNYIPILWYAVPIYFVIAGGSIGLGALFDRDRFLSDIKNLKSKFLKLIRRRKI